MPKGKETVRIIRKPKVDKLKPASGPTAEFDIEGCHVIPRASNESGAGWIQISGYTVVAPGAADIHEDDEMVVRGAKHSVIGRPGVFFKGSKPKHTFATVVRA